VTREATLAVIGAINVDLVVSGAALPRAGETVAGGVFTQHEGGKGGNQAVAAARVLRPEADPTPDASRPPDPRVVMVGAVGDDPALGVAALDALRRDLVETSDVLIVPGVSTGVALIAVDPGGENQISVAPGANAHLPPEHVVHVLERRAPNIVLASLEVPAAAVRAAVGWASERGTPFVLNPAPAGGTASEIATEATYVTPNASELERLGPLPPDVVVIETRGALGALIHAEGERIAIPAPPVVAVDTTGAGDCFNGVFAAGLLEGRPLEEAVHRAVVAAALSVRERGAREGMPDPRQIDRMLSRG
jgi:ribokinase